MVLIDSSPVRERVLNSATIREEDGMSTLFFHAMGTRCRVSLVEPGRKAANEYLQAMLEWVADFEARYSRFIDTSIISRINAAAGLHPVEIDEETNRLLSLCDELHFFTQGVFDATALPLIRLWNWKAAPEVIPDEQTVAAVKELVGWRRVERTSKTVYLPRSGMCLDLGGIGKEYAVDMALQMGTAHGIEHLLVDFGQDLRVKGRPPMRPAWHLGLENPDAAGTCWGSVGVSDSAVATSGDYLRHFTANGRRYGHIVDPRTGYPVNNGCRAVTVIAPSCTMAGILSTTAFILGTKEGLDLIQRTCGAAGVILTEHQRFFTPRIHEYLVNS